MDFSSGVTRFVSYGASGTAGIFAFRTAAGGASSAEKVRIDGSLISENFKGSIHSVAAKLQNIPSCNGWTFWYKSQKQNLVSINILREKVRFELKLN